MVLQSLVRNLHLNACNDSETYRNKSFKEPGMVNFDLSESELSVVSLADGSGVSTCEKSMIG